jgi:hypothetical protein
MNVARTRHRNRFDLDIVKSKSAPQPSGSTLPPIAISRLSQDPNTMASCPSIVAGLRFLGPWVSIPVTNTSITNTEAASVHGLIHLCTKGESRERFRAYRQEHGKHNLQRGAETGICLEDERKLNVTTAMENRFLVIRELDVLGPRLDVSHTGDDIYMLHKNLRSNTQ